MSWQSNFKSVLLPFPVSCHFRANSLLTSSTTSPPRYHNQGPGWAHRRLPLVTSRSSVILFIPSPKPPLPPPPVSRLHREVSNATYGFSTPLKISWHCQRLIFLHLLLLYGSKTIICSLRVKSILVQEISSLSMKCCGRLHSVMAGGCNLTLQQTVFLLHKLEIVPLELS